MKFPPILTLSGHILQIASITFLTILSMTLIAASISASFGILPWLTLSIKIGETVIQSAGLYIQVIVTLMVTSFLFVVPMNARIMQLETTHRNFQIGMEDIARAFHVCHTADRAGIFTLSSEFDAVRERLAFLRDHPDLGQLEPAVLQVAAQMSQQSKYLADVFSDAKVERAKGFLRQRQMEVERQQEQIVQAKHVCSEIKTWARQIEHEEGATRAQLNRLEETICALLPPLGYDLRKLDNGGSSNVLKLSSDSA